MRKYFIISFIILVLSVSIVHAQQPGVAINTNGNAPHSSAMLDVQSTDKGILIPRMTTIQRTAISNLVKGLLVFDNSTSSFWFYNGTSWEELKAGNSDNTWETSSNAIFNKNSGNVGIGINTPFEKLDVDGNLKLTGNERFIKMQVTPAGTGGPIVSNKYEPGVQFARSNGTILGKIEYVDTLDFANFLRLYTGATPSHDLTIGSDHNVGVGTADPQAKLHINGGANEQLRIHKATNPIVQFTDGVFGAQNKKGFIQLSGSDFRLGTNSENDQGRFIIRTGGINRLVTAANGNVGIGTEDPLTPLHVKGSILSESNISSFASMEAENNIRFGGELQRISTGSANLAPYAYGVVDADGTIISGTGNFTVQASDMGYFTITCLGIGMAATIVVSTSYFDANAGSSIIDANKFRVNTGEWNRDEKNWILKNYRFNFIVYKP